MHPRGVLEALGSSWPQLLPTVNAALQACLEQPLAHDPWDVDYEHRDAIPLLATRITADGQRSNERRNR